MSASSEGHAALLLQTARALYVDGQLFDATVSCDGQVFPVHSLILASYSSHLKAMLVCKGNSDNRLCLDGIGISADVMLAIISFMYTGTLMDIPGSDGEKLYEAATKLGMPQLSSLLLSSARICVDDSIATEQLDSMDSACAGEEMESEADVLITVKLEGERQDDMFCEESDAVTNLNAEVAKQQVVSEALKGEISELISTKVAPKRGRGRPRKAKKKTTGKAAVVTRGASFMAKGTVEESKKMEPEREEIHSDASNVDDGSGTMDVSNKTGSKSKKTKREETPEVKKRKERGETKSRKGADGLVHCQKCDYTTKTNKGFYNHWMLKHTEGNTHTCQHCGKTFKLRKYLVSHMAMHTTARPFSCEECGASFKLSKHLQRHRKTHREKEHTCETCGRMYFRSSDLKQHILSAHEDHRFVCTVEGCKFRSTSADGVKKHCERKHTDKSPGDIVQQPQTPMVLCDICGKNFVNRQAHKMHMLLHTGEMLKCKVCDYSTVNKHVLKSHMMRKHGIDLDGNKAEYRRTCELCGQGCFTMGEFKLHMLRHNGLKPHKCPICDHTTVDKGSLKKHIRAHTGETPFKCKICAKTFSQQSGYARHRRIHMGVKPHVCEQCGKAYADKKSLNAHKYSSHLNVKPFVCHICHYECTKKEFLTKHIRTVHGDIELPPGFVKKRTPLARASPTAFLQQFKQEQDRDGESTEETSNMLLDQVVEVHTQPMADSVHTQTVVVDTVDSYF